MFHDTLRESAWRDLSMCRRALKDIDTFHDPVALEMIALQMLGAAKILQLTGTPNTNLPPVGICPP